MVMDPQEYFREKGCNYWREMEPAYGLLHVQGKVVVVVGGDCGTTNLFFKMRGAKYVVAYEKEKDLREMWWTTCRDFSMCDDGEMRGEWRGEYPYGQVFVMDCEGCEDSLDPGQLSNYEEWCVGIHDWAKRRVDLFRRLRGSTFTHVSDDGREITLCHTS
jgi:hypothetical protein